jgi:hypothetical protein
MNCILYIHGKGGSASECEFYKPIFKDCDVIGLDYKTFTPWQAGANIREAQYAHGKPDFFQRCRSH